MPDDGLFSRLTWIPETGSTNADLAAAARAGEPAQVLVAEHQTAGRGRRDRTWAARPGTSLAISALWYPRRRDAWSWLPLLTGVAVCDTARAVGVPAHLKWPNDVLVPRSDGTEGKLAGLLAERVEGPRGAGCVHGMGLNTTATADDLCVPTATSLVMSGATVPSQRAIVSDLLGRLERLLGWWDAGESDDLVRDLYLNRCATVGRTVRVELLDGTVTGEAVGIDGDGGLVVRTAAGERSFVAGDVVHLR